MDDETTHQPQQFATVLFWRFANCHTDFVRREKKTHSEIFDRRSIIAWIIIHTLTMEPNITTHDDPIQSDAITQVWTDGACSKNGSIDSSAGIGVWFGTGDPRNVSAPVEGYCTAYRAELEAVIRAMTITLRDPQVILYCDNRTVVDGFEKYDLDAWAKQGWKVEIKELVAWQHIWLLQLTRKHLNLQPVVAKHVYSHANDYGNNEADKLAVHGRKSKIPPSAGTRM